MDRQRRGLFQALLRRENGSSLPTDERTLLSYVEDKTASSCFKEKDCQLSGTTRSTFLVCFSHDRSKMASTHGDHTIRVVDSFTGRFVRTLQGHPRTPWCISFHPSNNNLLASGCLGGEVRIWDLMGGCEVYTPPEKAVIASLAFHPIDHVLLIATSNKLYFWQWEQPKPFACLESSMAEEKIRLVKFSPFGDKILTGITNFKVLGPNEQQNRTQASVDQVLQSVNCTELDSNHMTDYIMQQTRGIPQATRGRGRSRSRRQTPQDQDENSPSGVQSSSNTSSSTQAYSGPDTQATRNTSNNVSSNRETTNPLAADETRPTRNYRGVFALFRARDTGSWNPDPSDVDGEPTHVGRSNLLFSEPTTDSISVDRVDIGATADGGDRRRQDLSSSVEVGLNPASSSRLLPLSSSSTGASSSSSSASSQSSLPSMSAPSLSDNTSSLTNILQGDSSVVMPPDMASFGTSYMQNDLLRPATNESVVSTSGNEDVSQSISILPINPLNRDSDVSVAMATDVMGANDDFGSRDTRSTGVNVQMDSSVSAPPRENTDGYVSSVGSVVNVESGVSSRTSYVAHGSNYSSSLSTLSNQEGSGTAIATATARTFRHVHTAVVIANGNERGPQVALRTAINRAIAGAFAGSGEGAVASNIINTTHRLQWWDFSDCVMPDIKNANHNVIIPCCKIHNDASCDLSADGSLLAAFVPSALGFPDDGMLAVYSMRKETLGQCLYTKKFGPNAISISISPLNTHVVVGLAARRIHWHLTSQQMIAQVFKLEPDKNSAYSFTELKSPVHNVVLNEEESERRTHVSVNAAFWHPVVGCGLVYGTNRGDLRMRQFGLES